MSTPHDDTRAIAPSLWPWFLAILALILTFLAINRSLLTHAAAPIWDAYDYFQPYYILVAEHARAGQLLFWDPWTEAGHPAGFDPQVGAFSPLQVLSGLITGGTLIGFNHYWALIWLAGGLGLLFLTKHLGAPAWASFALGLAFLYSGFYTGHAQHTPYVLTFSAMPWTLWRLDVALIQRRHWPAIEAGAILGLAALSGYPGMMVTIWLFLLLWSAGRILSHTTPPLRSRLAHATLALAAAGLVCALIAAPAYTGFLVDGRGYTVRTSALSREVAVGSNALGPRELLTIISPCRMTGFPTSPLHPDLGNSCYLSPLVLCLAAIAVAARPRATWRWWLLAMGLLGLGLALGDTLPLRGWLYDWVPPTRYYRHASMFRAWTILAWCVLAAMGAQHLLAQFRQPTKAGAAAMIIPTALLTGVSATVIGLCMTSPDFQSWSCREYIHACAIWLGPLLIVLTAALARRIPALAKYAILLLCLLVVFDGHWTHELSSTLYSRNPEPEAQRHDLQLSSLDRSPGGTVSNRHLLAKTPVFRAYTPMHNPWGNRTILPRAATGPDRVWFAADALEVPPSPAMFDALAQRADARGASPLAVHTPSQMLDVGSPSPIPPDALASLDRLPDLTPLPTTLLTYTPNELAFRATAPTQGWLFVTDRWARPWRATVDGQPTDVWGGMFQFRALRVPAGDHEIRFSYHPTGHPWLLILSWSTLAIIAASTIALQVRRVLRPRTTDAPTKTIGSSELI